MNVDWTIIGYYYTLIQTIPLILLHCFLPEQLSQNIWINTEFKLNTGGLNLTDLATSEGSWLHSGLFRVIRVNGYK